MLLNNKENIKNKENVGFSELDIFNWEINLDFTYLMWNKIIQINIFIIIGNWDV